MSYRYRTPMISERSLPSHLFQVARRATEQNRTEEEKRREENKREERKENSFAYYITATTDQIVVAKKMVRKLRIKFDSRDFENPVLQKHYANLQALALDRDAVDAVQDMIMPDVEGFQKLSTVIEEYKQAVFGDAEYNPALTKAKKKATGEGARKRKLDRPLEELDDIVRSGNAKTLKVDELKFD
jgi:ATP-dependent DNA helicase 2 subunit 1